MSRKSNGFTSRKAIISALLTAMLSTAAFAGQASFTGLGQSWPNATNVSASPHYHVYIFLRDGIRYIQINDLSGTVQGAVAAGDDEVLVLPIGVDAQSVSVTQANTAADKTADSAETVYSDSALQITAATESNGMVQFKVTPMNKCADNPLECNSGNVISKGVGN